jgi:NADH-quinone oxidoreductase subunit N
MIWLLSAEIVLIATAVAIYLAGAFVDARRWWSWIALGGIILAGAALWSYGKPGAPHPQAGARQAGTPPPAPSSAAASDQSSSAASTETSGGPVTMDPLAYYGRWLALALGALLVLMAFRPLETPGTPEYVGSLLLAVAGVMLVCSAGNLVLMFVGLELISIPTYILLYLGRRDAQSQESAAKYFFLSILASAMLLYGFSFLYGTAGSTNLSAIRAAWAQPGGAAAGLATLGKVAFVLIFAGLGFKITAVPFHFYAPDVYQGTTYPNAGLLSVLPKAAGLVALVRIAVLAMPTPPDVKPYAWLVVLVLSMLTMTFGNVMALWQENLRRLLAYSAVAHAGYMLIGLAVALVPVAAQGKWNGVSALVFYLSVYAVATLGAFAALEFLGRQDRPVEAVEELAGLGRTRPFLAVAIAVFMFSLAGIPPLAGFWGKLVVFASALNVDAGNLGPGTLWPWFVALAVVGVLNAAVAAAYYLRIVAVMYFRTPLAVLRPRGGAGAWLAASACAVLIILIGVFPGPLLRQSDIAGPRSGHRAEVGTKQVGPGMPARQPGTDRRLVVAASLAGEDAGLPLAHSRAVTVAPDGTDPAVALPPFGSGRTPR